MSQGEVYKLYQCPGGNPVWVPICLACCIPGWCCPYNTGASGAETAAEAESVVAESVVAESIEECDYCLCTKCVCVCTECESSKHDCADPFCHGSYYVKPVETVPHYSILGGHIHELTRVIE